MKRLTSLEKAVINKFLETNNMKPLSEKVLLDVSIRSRRFTAIGFLTEIETPELLHCALLPDTFAGGNVAAKINKGEVEAGFVIYLEKKNIKAIEGYDTRSELWPNEISCFDLYLHDHGNKPN